MTFDWTEDEFAILDVIHVDDTGLAIVIANGASELLPVWREAE
jgi:hypothetical protein